MSINAGEIAKAYLAVRADLAPLGSDMEQIKALFVGQINEIQRLANVKINAQTDGGGLSGLGGVIGTAAAGLAALAAAAAAAGTALAAGLGAAVGKAAEFEQAMASAGVSFDIYEQKGNATFDALKAKAIELGKATKFTSSEVATAFGVFGQAGFTAEQSMAAMNSTLSSAAANTVSVAEAAELASGVMRNFGMQAQDLEHINDAMTVAAAQSAAGFNDMAYALKYAAPAAKAAGVSLEELLSMVARLADVGIKGETAGTSIRGALADLVSPSKAAKDELKKLGVSIDKITEKGGFFKVMEQLAKANMSMASAVKIFGVQQATPMLAMLNQIDSAGRKGVDSLRALTAQMNDAANVGVTNKKADALMDTFKGQFERLTGELEAMAIAIGTPLAAALRPFAQDIENLFQQLGGLNWESFFADLGPAFDEARGMMKSFYGTILDIAKFVQENGATWAQWAIQVKTIVGNVVGWALAELKRFWTDVTGLDQVFNWGNFKAGMQVILDYLEKLTSNGKAQWELLKIGGEIAFRQIGNRVQGLVADVILAIGKLANASVMMLSNAFNPANWITPGAASDAIAKIMVETMQSLGQGANAHLDAEDKVLQKLVAQGKALQNQIEQQDTIIRKQREIAAMRANPPKVDEATKAAEDKFRASDDKATKMEAGLAKDSAAAWDEFKKKAIEAGEMIDKTKESLAAETDAPTVKALEEQLKFWEEILRRAEDKYQWELGYLDAMEKELELLKKQAEVDFQRMRQQQGPMGPQNEAAPDAKGGIWDAKGVAEAEFDKMCEQIYQTIVAAADANQKEEKRDKGGDFKAVQEMWKDLQSQILKNPMEKKLDELIKVDKDIEKKLEGIRKDILDKMIKDIVGKLPLVGAFGF